MQTERAAQWRSEGAARTAGVVANRPTPELNVLVSAFRTDAPHHRICRDWLEQALAGE